MGNLGTTRGARALGAVGELVKCGCVRNRKTPHRAGKTCCADFALGSLELILSACCKFYAISWLKWDIRIYFSFESTARVPVVHDGMAIWKDTWKNRQRRGVRYLRDRKNSLKTREQLGGKPQQSTPLWNAEYKNFRYSAEWRQDSNDANHACHDAAIEASWVTGNSFGVQSAQTWVHARTVFLPCTDDRIFYWLFQNSSSTKTSCDLFRGQLDHWNFWEFWIWRRTSTMSDHVALQKIKAPSSKHARLQILPPSICKLRALNLLFLRFNQLETLPFAIGNCTSLTALDIRDNPIVYLPFSVAKLPMKGSDFYLDVPREELMFPPGKVTVRACIMISCWARSTRLLECWLICACVNSHKLFCWFRSRRHTAVTHWPNLGR